MVYLLVFAYRRKEPGNGFLVILNFVFEKWDPGLNSLEKEYKRLTKNSLLRLPSAVI